MFSYLKQIFKLQFVLVLAAILVGVLYPQILDHAKSLIFRVSSNDDPVAVQFSAKPQEELFTKESLAQFDGRTEETPIYLSILGSVFDVSRGRKHYGSGCSYNFFAGRDASRAFSTGDFESNSEDLDDVATLEPKEIMGLVNWKEFYHKDYVYKGKLIGRFYDETGARTEYSYKIDSLVELAKADKVEEERRKSLFPPCNIEWSAETGTKVWCTEESGGIKRDFVGVPRKYFEPGKETYRCACVSADKLNSPLLKSYDGCDTESDACFYNVD